MRIHEIVVTNEQLIYFSVFGFNKIAGEERALSLVKWFIQIGIA